MYYYLPCWKKLAINVVLVFGVSGWFSTAKGIEVSPREQVFLLSAKKTFEYYCSPCHGQKGKGDGTFFTIDLKPKPRNFTDLDYMKKKDRRSAYKVYYRWIEICGKIKSLPSVGKNAYGQKN